MRRARLRVLFSDSSERGWDRSAIALPPPLVRAAIPAADRERMAWLGVATTGIDSEVPERFSPARRSERAGAQESIS